MSKARIRWIAGLSLVAIAVVAGGGYFYLLWRKAVANAAETAKADKTVDKGASPKLIPAPEAEDEGAEPPTELGAFDKSRFAKRPGSTSSRLSMPSPKAFEGDGDSGTEFSTANPPAPRGALDLDQGGFDDQPAPPTAFGGSATSSGGGFDETPAVRRSSPRAGGGAKISDASLEFPAPDVGLDPPAPNRLTDEPIPDARLANDPSNAKPPSSRRTSPSLRRETASPSAHLSEDASTDLAPPSAKPLASRPAFDSRGARGASSVSGRESSKIDGPHADGQGSPGPKQLEGLQAPSLALEKAAPAEIQVGKPATFQIKVRNVGQVEAHEVVVYDEVPKGTRFVDATPQAGRAPDGALMWQLGTIRPGEEQTISLQLMPTAEGEIGSVARVAFQAQASARTISTRPQLKVEHTAAPKVLIGQGVSLAIKISNPGTGAATNVVLEEDVPEGLSHPAGSELEFEVGTLRPGESKTLELTLKAEKPGQITNVLLVRGDAGLLAEDRLQIEVIAPQLEVDMKGPTRRFLDRQATYVFSVANRGTAPAREVELVAHLPKGFKFVETNNAGQYDPQRHAVFWSLAELPPAESGAVQLVTIPIEPGEQKLRVEGRAELGLSDAREQAVLVESVAQLLFDVIDSADPIEVGSETVYQVRIVNQGTRAATNVRLAAALPGEMEPVGGDGPTKVAVEGQRVQFEPLARLAPKGEATYRIQARGLKAGDPRIRVQVSSDEVQSPVTKEESTKVYSDQ